MRVLLLGATGFVGAAVLARLRMRGIAVRALNRARAPRPLDGVEWVRGDLRTMTDAAQWGPLLAGCAAVINCAGVFADSARDSTSLVHVEAPIALYRACEEAGVKRVILLSAIGVDDRLTGFARTKKDGESVLSASKLEWVILRPSIILGTGASGGSALLRALAALPVLPVEQGQGEIQPVQLDDVVDTITLYLGRDVETRTVQEVVGPRRYTLAEIVPRVRAWLGWRPAKRVTVPAWLMALVYAGGGVANLLGWRTPVSLTGRREMQRGATGKTENQLGALSRPARSVEDAFASHAATYQDRLAAKLYLLAPAVFIVTILFWVGTGITSIGPGYGIGVRLLEAGGVGALSRPSVVAGGLADICIGLGIAWRPTTRPRTLRGDRDIAVLLCSRHHAFAPALARSDWTNAQDLAASRIQHCRACAAGQTMTAYLLLKYIHVIGACVLLGTGAGIAFFMLFAHMTQRASMIAPVARIVVVADFVFTTTAVIVQPITGFLLMQQVGYPIAEGWIHTSLLLYVLTGVFWLPVVWFQMKMRDLAIIAVERNEPLPERYFTLAGKWVFCGFPAFASVMAILWLMIARPSFSLF